MTNSEALKAALHRVFDEQIPNYGDYNLVCAAAVGGTVPPSPSAMSSVGAVPHRPFPQGFVLGYRRHPEGLMIAPFDRRSLRPVDSAFSIDNANLGYAEEIHPGSYDVCTSMGRYFCFTVTSECVLGPGPGGGLRMIEQEEDVTDFREFMHGIASI